VKNVVYLPQEDRNLKRLKALIEHADTTRLWHDPELTGGRIHCWSTTQRIDL
jgi:hypothetical protein